MQELLSGQYVHPVDFISIVPILQILKELKQGATANRVRSLLLTTLSNHKQQIHQEAGAPPHTM